MKIIIWVLLYIVICIIDLHLSFNERGKGDMFWFAGDIETIMFKLLLYLFNGAILLIALGIL